MVRIAVVDDAENIALAIRRTLEGHDFGVRISVDDYMSGKELLAKARTVRYDVLVMDIELSEEHQAVEENGMYLASKIKAMYPETTIIYITGTVCYGKDLLFHEPFRYIQKPVMNGEICKAVEDAVFRVGNVEEKSIGVRIGGVGFMLRLNEITYFVSDRRKITAHMADDDVEFYERMNDLERRVRELSGHFVRAGKSYLVNLQHVRSISRTEIRLFDSTGIPVSRKYKETVVAEYEKFVESIKGVSK